MKKNRIRWAAALLTGILLAGSTFAPATATGTDNRKQTKKQFDANGIYHAALGVSTAVQPNIKRNAYFSKKANALYKTGQWNKLTVKDPNTGVQNECQGKFKDIKIKGNGKYTVRLKNADFGGQTALSKLHVATDIPVNNKVTFSDVTAKINGQTILTFEEPFMEDKKRFVSGGMDILLLENQRQDLVEQINGRGIYLNSEGAYDLVTGTGEDTIQVTFTVSGFDYKKGEKRKPEKTPAPTAEQTAKPDPAANKKKQEELLPAVTADPVSADTAPDRSTAIFVVVAVAIVSCGGVVAIVNSRSKRK